VSARERLRIMIGTDPGTRTVWSLGEVESALDAFAHELAEWQRAYAEQEGAHLTTSGAAFYVQGIQDAADLIDPGVESDRG
jgi:hypothetical protein